MLLIGAVGLIFLTSCENENEVDITSLASTRWESDDGRVEVIFTDTHATITETRHPGVDDFTGTYSYDPPNVIIVGDVWNLEGVPFTMPYQMEHEGTVKGRTMDIAIQKLDLFMHTILTKQ